MGGSYREGCIEAKAVRHGVIEQRPVNRAAKKRMAKNVVVEIRYPNFSMKWCRDWHTFGAYPDVETANQVIANKTRGSTSSAEYRIKPSI